MRQRRRQSERLNTVQSSSEQYVEERGVIVYYVVGPVHPRNAVMLASHMPGWSFRITREPHVSWFADGQIDRVPLPNVPLEGDKPPQSLWEGDVRAAIFSTVQPRPGPINLLQNALERGIPTIAIQEGNQLALNNGRVNNYMFPVDRVLAASEYERQGLIDAGVCQQRVIVTGWPFHAGRTGPTPAEDVRAARRRLGLDPLRPVASLTLTPLDAPMEGPAERRRQLALAAEGLRPEYQLAIKPHPVESLDMLMPFVEECAAHARAIEPATPIERLLQATDVLLNRGTSQVCIEALHRDIAVFIIDIGRQTPFHDLAADVIIHNAPDLSRCMGRLSADSGFMAVYDRFKQAHMPFAPLAAKQITCQQIADIASGAGDRLTQPDQWFELAMSQAWISNRSAAMELLASPVLRESDQPTDELSRLVEHKASPQDLNKLKQAVTPAFWGHVLRCLWIDQLNGLDQELTDVDIEWMSDFPPDIDVYWFAAHTVKWLRILTRSHKAQVAAECIEKLRSDFAHVPSMAQIVSDACG